VTISTGFTNNSTAAGLDVTLARVAGTESGPGDSIEIDYTVTIKATTPAGTVIPNTVNLTYTSLPGPNGTPSNPTGQSTPGTSGTPTGERDGSGGVGGSYVGTATQTITVNTSSLSGFVYRDLNGDGLIQTGEPGLAGVTVTLTGKDFLGNAVNLTTTTNGSGQYTFANLLPSDPVTRYKITETQPAGLLNGKETLTSTSNFTGTIGTGSSPGTVVQFSDVFATINIGRESRITGTRYDFGEQTLTNRVPPPQTLREETTLIFCHGGPLEISVTDPNPADMMEVAIAVPPGTGILTLTNLQGITFTAGGNNTPSMTFRGNVNAVNLALSNVSFVPAPLFNGSTSITITSQELDALGNPVPGITGTNVVPITVTPINHAPTVQAPASQATNENVAITFSTAGGNAIVVGDPDVNPAVQVEQLTLTVTKGKATLATTSGLTSVIGNGTASVIVTGTINALNAALNGLVFTPTANTYGAAGLLVSINDLANTVGPALMASKSIPITVAQVNQAPVIVGPASVTRTAGSFVFSGANKIAVSDVDAGTSIEQVTLNVSTGTLTLGSITGLASVSGNGTTSITISGTLAYLNLALTNLRYTGDATTLSIVMDDLGSTGLGGPLTASWNVLIL
jgi:hypothetical protein